MPAIPATSTKTPSTSSGPAPWLPARRSCSSPTPTIARTQSHQRPHLRWRPMGHRQCLRPRLGRLRFAHPERQLRRVRALQRHRLQRRLQQSVANGRQRRHRRLRRHSATPARPPATMAATRSATPTKHSTARPSMACASTPYDTAVGGTDFSWCKPIYIRSRLLSWVRPRLLQYQCIHLLEHQQQHHAGFGQRLRAGDPWNDTVKTHLDSAFLESVLRTSPRWLNCARLNARGSLQLRL